MSMLTQMGRKTCAVLAFLAAGAAQATVLTLPAPNYYMGQQVNNFNIYSLDLLATCMATDPRCQPASGLPVQSSPGQIADQAVVLSGQAETNIPSPFAAGTSVDAALETPSGNQSSVVPTATFGNDTTVNFVGDQLATWEIKLSALQSYLGTHDLVFLFDNGQAQNPQAANLILWAQARIIDAAGNLIGANCFEFSIGSGCGSITPAASAYVPVLNSVCVDTATGAFVGPASPSNQGSCPAGSLFVDNNQGTSNAEFAAYSAALSAAAKNAANGDYFLSINMRYLSNEGVAEQLWICSTCDVGGRRVDLPEPASLALLGLGMLVLYTVRRRSQLNS